MVPLLCALLCFAIAPAPTPDPPQDTDEVAVHMAVLRDKKADAAARQAAMEALLDLGTEGPRQLASLLGRQIKDLRRDTEKTRQTLVGKFEAEAAAVLEGRLDRDGKEALGKHRKTILRLARNPKLTKQMVVEESDPARAKLEAIVVVTVDHVFAADAELAEDLTALRADLARDAHLFLHWRLARGRLAVHPEGGKLARGMTSPGETPYTGEALDADLAWIAKLTTTMTDGDRGTFAANHALRNDVPPDEAEGTEILNLLRVHLGLNALRLDPKLCRASRDHSRDMQKQGFFSHDSPVEGKETFGKRAARAGTSASAENIARGQQTPAGAIQGWWHSPGHHRNMLGGHRRAGLGRYKDHWTQMFGN